MRCCSCGVDADEANPRCRNCTREYVAEWRQRNKAAQKKIADRNNAKNGRRHYLKYRYGITPEQYDEMLEAQEGVCAICKEAPTQQRLAVDHDHKTGEVRGLLCFSCNTALGHFRDDPERLISASDYLTCYHRTLR